MKLRVAVDIDVSPTLAATIQRGGFTVGPDGSVKVGNDDHTPAIPKRKVKLAFVENPSVKFDTIKEDKS